jgi:hypothetical protein
MPGQRRAPAAAASASAAARRRPTFGHFLKILKFFFFSLTPRSVQKKPKDRISAALSRFHSGRESSIVDRPAIENSEA